MVFSIFAFSGWESAGPLAEESKNPKRYVPIGLVGSVIILMIYFVFVTWGYMVGIGVDKVDRIPEASAFPVATLAQRVWGGAWLFLLFALLNSAIAVSIACFNGGTRTWYAMGRSGVLPSAARKVAPTQKTPDNAITLEIAVNVLAFTCVLIFGVENVFFTWANAITIGLVLMYILGNIGVMKYYLTEGRAPVQRPAARDRPGGRPAPGSSWCGSRTSRRSPAPGPVSWGLLCSSCSWYHQSSWSTCGSRGNEAWMGKAQLVFEQSGGAH